jgi:DNA-binding transcriptional LysR family regulator
MITPPRWGDCDADLEDQGVMQDLNDFYYFAEVVAHGGFAAASRALNIPKSKLSRRIAQLERRLEARLIERSTRRFRVTEVGQAFYERCRTVLVDAESAEAVVAEARGEAQGLVRFSCPVGLVEPIQPVISAYLKDHAKVRLQMLATNKVVDLIEEEIDVALRARTTPETDASLIMRTLATTHAILVASPELAATIPPDADIADMTMAPTLSIVGGVADGAWTLVGPDGEVRRIRHTPRLSCGELTSVRSAAVDGLGVALLPERLCRTELAEGRLVQVFAPWRSPEGAVYLVFTGRRGLPPAVRIFIDYLARFFRENERWR